MSGGHAIDALRCRPLGAWLTLVVLATLCLPALSTAQSASSASPSAEEVEASLGHYRHDRAIWIPCAIILSWPRQERPSDGESFPVAAESTRRTQRIWPPHPTDRPLPRVDSDDDARGCAAVDPVPPAVSRTHIRMGSLACSAPLTPMNRNRC